MTAELRYDQEGASDSDPLNLGSQLRQARVSGGITLDDAQRTTRISRRYLEALEADDYAALPAPVFARGFLRSYAQFLGLDASALVARFPGEARPPDALPNPRAAGPRIEVGRRHNDRRREDPDDIFDPYRDPGAAPAEHLALIPHVDTRGPSVRLGPWLVAGFVVLVVLAGVVAVVTLGDDEPSASPVAAPPGVAVDPELPVATEAAAQEQPTINLDTMPDFLPRSVEDALTILRRSGLSFALIEVFDAATLPGTILEQLPLPGEPLNSSSTVTLVVSRGPTPAEPRHGRWLAVRYHLTTLGCPKNVTDSHSLERTLASAGHAPAGSDAADVLIVNTCGFIDAAKEESRAVTAQLADAKRPGQQLFVIGCWSQLDGDRIRAALPAVDAVFGIEAWDRIAAALGPASPPDIPDAAAAPTRTSAYLKISDGCARPCTFCNIPGIKGDRFRTTPLETLLEQARAHADAGAKELVLVAQDSTAYGEEQGERDGLPALLRALAAAVPDLPWLRLMYAYPGRVSHALVETMADLPQCCHYLDIPLQHGSPTVLRRMKRPHNVPMVLDTLGRLRAAMPDIAIRTTFIVGFPGETEAEFDELLSFVRTTRFDRAGAFVYSPQKGTPAALMPDQIPEPLKAERLERLMALQAQISAEINASLVGRELPILVESVEGSTGPDGEPIFVGRSYRDAPEIDGLVFANGLARPGTMPHVRITAAMEHDLFATPIGADAALPLLQL